MSVCLIENMTERRLQGSILDSYLYLLDKVHYLDYEYLIFDWDINMGKKVQTACDHALSVEEINTQILIEESAQLLRETKMNNWTRSVEKIFIFALKLIGLVLSLALLLGSFGFLTWWICIYCTGSPLANTVLTIMQVITGVVSLVVGIWALVLTIKSERRASDTEKYAHIRKINANNDITAQLVEADVNKKSL